MSALLDWGIVLLVLAAALLWLARNFRRARTGSCSSGCGTCEEARRPAPAGRRPAAPGRTPLASTSRPRDGRRS